MSDFTIHNVRETEDMAPKFGFGDVQEARFCGKDVDAAKTGFALFNIKPGQGGIAHKHDEAEEVYLVLSGSGQAKLDDEVVDIKAYDAIRVAPKVVRAFKAGDDGMELLAFGARHEGDGELLLDAKPWG